MDDPTREVRKGVVTVRNATSFSQLIQSVRGDLYMELSVGSAGIIGRTPRWPSYDDHPLLEHTMRSHDFEAGEALRILFVERRSTSILRPSSVKDTVVGEGALVISPDLLSRKVIVEELEIYSTTPLGANESSDYKPPIGTVNFKIDFYSGTSTGSRHDPDGDNGDKMQENSSLYSEVSSNARKPVPTGRAVAVDGVPLHQFGDGHSTNEEDLMYKSEQEYDEALQGETSNGRDDEDGMVTLESMLQSAGIDSMGLGQFGLDKPLALSSVEDGRLHVQRIIVDYQYWERPLVPREGHVVLFTPAVTKLLRALRHHLFAPARCLFTFCCLEVDEPPRPDADVWGEAGRAHEAKAELAHPNGHSPAGWV